MMRFSFTIASAVFTSAGMPFRIGVFRDAS